MKKTLELSIEKARELYNSGNEQIKSLILETFTEEELKRDSFDKLIHRKGYFVADYSEVKEAGINGEEDKNIYHTKEQAEASIAQAQLTHHIDIANRGWKPHWGYSETKYCIVPCGIHWEIVCNAFYKRFLTFKTREIAEQFLKEHIDLLDQYRPLA